MISGIDIILILIFSAFLGAGFGSGIQCAAMRYGDGRNWLTGRSRCDFCGEKLAWHQLIPVFSFVLHRGKCSRCHAKLDLSYLSIELLGAFLVMLIVLQFLNDANILIVFRSLMIVTFALFSLVLDAYKKLVSVSFSLAIGGIIMFIPVGIPWTSLFFGLVFGISFFLIQYLLTKGKGIGLGDSYLGAVMGISLGWPLIIPGILIGYIIGMPHALFLLARKKANAKTELSLGVYLMLGLLVVYFTQDFFKIFFL